MEKVTKTARTLLMVAVMIASAILPMVPEAAELRDEARAMGASITTDVTSVTLDEGGSTMYEVSLDEAPDGTLVITPSSDNPAVTVDPSYIKFTKANWDTSQWVYVDILDTDDDGADTTATITHSISGTDTVFATAPGDVSVTGTDYDTDFDGDGLHDGVDSDDDGDGVDDSAEDAGCDLLADCDGDGVNDDADAFDTDATEDTDTDGDGVGDNSDAFPSDATEDTDTDGDGVGDNADAFPSDANETLDTDGDGVGDISDWDDADDTEDTDTDGDGVGDNADAFPSDATETLDTDGDGVGDNADAFPSDDTEDTDTDGDGVGNNTDAFPEDACADTDTDDDGIPDSVDETDADTDGTADCVTTLVADTDDDGDGVDDTAEEAGCDLVVDCDGDGVNDDADAFPLDDGAWTDTDGDGLADNIIAAGSGFSYDFEDGSLSSDFDSTSTWTVTNDAPLGDDYSAQAATITHSESTELILTLDTGEGLMSFDWGVSSENNYDKLWFFVDGVSVAGGSAWSGYTTVYDNTSPNYYASSSGSVYWLCDDGDVSDGVASLYSDIVYLSWVNDGGADCNDGSDEGATSFVSYVPVTGTYEHAITKGTHTFKWSYIKDSSASGGNDTAWMDNLFIPSAGALTAMGTGEDSDDDGDGYPDVDEIGNCASYTDPLNVSDFPANDNDDDDVCDLLDTDDDNDGVDDVNESDGSALDLDGDGTADGINCANSTDCDGDGVGDATDTHPVDPSETTDMDGDGIGDNGDGDVDGDGYLNTDDAFPNDDTEWADNDGDGIGDNADTDDDTCAAADGADTDGDGVADATCATFTGFGSWVDADGDGVQDYDFYPGDGVADVDDWDPMSPAETADNDGDGWGDNADYDDDGDGVADEDDDDMDGDGFDNVDETTTCASGTSDPQDGSDTPADMDGDGTCDDMDLDIDGDGTNNTDQGDGAVDAFPEDACADTDTDGDGKPDSLVTGCTSSLTEDMNDDSAQGEAHPNYGVLSSGTAVWVCTNGYNVWSGASYVSTGWVNDGGADCSDGSDENADTTGFGPGSSEDAWTDAKEIACGTDPLDDTDTPADLDGDDLCDEIEDTDNDGDGYSNADEVTNCAEAATLKNLVGTDANDSTDTPTDTDGDFICDVLDTDDDDDGSSDILEGDCGTDPLDDTDSPVDTDSDGICNGVDTDDDNDTVLDADEADGSGLVTATDCSLVYDCDGDGVSDANESDGSALDLDDDGTADGIECAASTDCDGDGTGDATDELPVDPNETTDFDGDGIGDNADTDDDADGYSDADETTNCDTGSYASTGDPMNGSETPDDNDGDGTCDALDNDVDGDDIPNPWDQCPEDASGYIDTDGDGLCDGDSDPDDDGDGTLDADDAFPLDGSEDTDTDGDGVGDNGDADDDDDGTDDQADECPLDSSGTTDYDLDGVCDVTDTDDDDDGVLDTDEEAGCDMVADCDGDGTGDATDDLDNDADAVLDTDGDGAADDFLAATTATTTTWNISTQSNSALTVFVYDENGSELCELVTNAGGSTSAGTDTANATAFCQATAGAIDVQAWGTDYYTYYGAVFGNWAPNVVVSVADGDEIFSVNAEYQWYYDNYFGNTYDLAFISTVNAEGTALDFDDDDDGYSDADETTNCGSGDSLDDTVTPDDNDGDGVCDTLDDDDDDDGYSDSHEADCGTDAMVAGDVIDFDGDGTCDSEDADDDDDGTDDDDDWAPYDSSEWADTDNDGVGDNEDTDADGDGTPDSDDSDPTDRCSSMDTDGDGLTDSYDDCSTMGFYTTLEADGTEGFDDGDAVGITDDTTHFWGAADGDQWFQASDTDGVLRMYVDHGTGVSAVSAWLGIASTEYEAEDYYASYWVGDDGTTTELGNSLYSWVDIDNCQCEGFWGQWVVEVPSEDGYLMLEVSTDDDAELLGVDNIAYHDSNWDVISMITFEDSVEDMGVYMTPSSPSLLVGTYTIDIADSWGDGGQSATAMHDGAVVCDITTDTNGASDSCTFTITGYSDTELDVDFTSDYYASEGSMDITFPDGTVSSYSPSASYATDSYSFAHTGTEILPMEGTYTIEISDVYADGGQEAMAWFDGAEVCSLTTDPGGIASDSCTFTATGYADSVLDVDFTSTDTWGNEGTMVITLPNGTALSYGNSADFATDSYSFAHDGTVVQLVAGEIELSNGHGATVSLNVDEYHTGTVDDDDDDDGWYDADDAFPTDDSEWDDMDGDGIGSNADTDDDGDGTNDGWDDFPRHAHADTDTDGDGMPDEIGWIDGEIGDDFELGNFSGMDDYSANGWDRSGDSLFGLASGTAFDGYAARAGIVSDNESSTLELEIYTSEGYVSFDYMVSSEERYDTLSFSIDGMEYMAVSGQDYHWEFLCTTAGSYTDLAWEDSSLNDGSIPGNWVNDGFADCGDSDGDGTSDDEGLNNWYSMVEGSFETWVGEGDHTFTWTYAKDGSASGGSDRAYFDNVVIPYGIMGEGECADNTDLCNIEDLDDDEDGLEDLLDDCPTEAGEQIDTDGDGWCDNSDADDDNDGVYDYNDAMPLDPNETTDFDGDGIGDNADTDDDNDGCLDEDDALPYDDSDCYDLDGDGVGDTADPDDDGDNVMDVDDPFPEDGSAWLDTDGDGMADYTGDPPFDGTFEGGAIPMGFVTYGDADWFVCDAATCIIPPFPMPINGTYSAQSGDIPDQTGGATTTLEWSGETLAGDITFAYVTSSETNWDFLRFIVDGSIVSSWSGQTSGTFTHSVAAGNHTIQWQYYKDSIISSFDDTAWVDDIELPVSQQVFQDDMDDDNDGVYDEMDLDPMDPCVAMDTDGDLQPDTVLDGLFDMSGTGDEDFIVDCDDTAWIEDWDDDGDGWSDDDEMMCGSNHLDGDEFPWDFDQDWVCDDLDDDLDDDGAINPVDNCELYLAWGDSAAFIDCIADAFHAVDADGDGDASQMELIHAWTFQWSGPDDGDDDDDWGDEMTFFCGDGSEIPFEWINDGITDCADGADEQQFDADGNPINWFDCNDGSTVWIDQVNDGLADCPDGEDEGDYYDGMDDGSDDEMGTMSHDGTNHTDDANDSDDWDDANGSDDDGMDEDMVCYNLVSHATTNDSAESCEAYGWFENASFDGMNFTGCYNTVSHEVTWDDQGTCESYMWVTASGGPDDGGPDDEGPDDEGPDDEEPEGPEMWPSAEDFDAFNAEFWGFVSAWDADNSSSMSFDEFWQFITDTEDDFDFANPGWSEDTTEWDQFPYDYTEQLDTDMDGMGDNSDPDDDGDGTPDSQDAFPLDGTEDADLDGDGIGDNSDNDTDGDGIDNDQDDFDSDPGAAADNDQDGIDDASDTDDDNDLVPDVADWAPMDPSEQYDTDGDGIGDNADTDDDGDGVEDALDAFPLDASETADNDNDGVGDNADPDDDNDNTPDDLDQFPTDANEQRDYDGDGIGDVADPDRDEDGYLNSDDAFPMNENEWLDTDGDNVGDNADSDIDGDSVANDDDWAPTDASEWDDTDGDGTGDNADEDDDGDTYPDTEEYSCGTDSKSSASTPSDFDGDGLCDALDDSDDRSQADKDVNAQEAPGFTPGFASVLAVVSLLGAAMLGRRKED